MESSIIYSIDKLYKAIVINRPSKVCKSPYLADVAVYNDEKEIIEENVMAHTPALGCCGYVEADSIVYCTKSASKTAKSKYVVQISQMKDINIKVGINPMLANPIVKELLLKNKIPPFNDIKKLKQEVKIGNSRFDFTFENQKMKVILEVKNVPIADVVDVDEKTRKKMDLSKYDPYEKIAIFPNGFRKNVNEPISERAVKHTNHLAEMAKDEKEDTICAIVFLIQRTDVTYFQPSNIDSFYQNALYKASDAGVLIIPICVEWVDNECKFSKILKMTPRENLENYKKQKDV
jgi:DNA-binding sugar fermentation-stimulating protein